MEAIIFYSFLWRYNAPALAPASQIQIFGRTDTGRKIVVTMERPVEYNDLYSLWIVTNFRPCAWYRISNYFINDIEGTLQVRCNWTDFDILNLSLMPRLAVLAVDDSQGSEDTTVYVEDFAQRRVFKFGSANINSPFYVQGNVQGRLPELITLFRVDIEFYLTRTYTNLPVHLVYEDIPSSFWVLLSQECLYSNDHLQNLV